MTDKTSPVSGTLHHAPEVFLFYRDKQLHHIHTDRKVFEDWMEKASWQYPPDRCEIVRYVPDGHAQRPAVTKEQIASIVDAAWKKSGEVPFPLYPRELDSMAADLLAALVDTSTVREAANER
jgi:hypothetical protein